MARSSWCWRSQACGESPVLSLKARQKWKRDRPASLQLMDHGCVLAIENHLVALERLSLGLVAPAPIARRFAGQLPECRGESGLRGIAKRCGHRDDRFVALPQHVHG